MNQEQELSLLRSFLTAIGPLLVGWGLLQTDQLGLVITAVVGLAGAVLTFGPAIWGILIHSHANAIATVNGDSIPGVTVVSVAKAKAANIPTVTAPIPPDGPAPKGKST